MRKRSSKKRKRFLHRIKIFAGILFLGMPVCFYLVNQRISEERTPESILSQMESYTENKQDEAQEKSTPTPVSEYYTIMGNTTVTLDDMTRLFERRNVDYPYWVLEAGGAGTLEDFCRIILEESEKETVRAEVVFAQAMLETGWLQYGGDSHIEQFNFAGLGTTGGGEPGNAYPDVRTGIRAQVQHLKAYASSEELNEDCVDDRFPFVQRESAPYVEWLGIQENPYGCGWAAGEDYGYKILALIEEIKKTK